MIPNPLTKRAFFAFATAMVCSCLGCVATDREIAGSEPSVGPTPAQVADVPPPPPLGTQLGSCDPTFCPDDDACCVGINGPCGFMTSSGCQSRAATTGSCDPSFCPQPGACCVTTAGPCGFVVNGTCEARVAQACDPSFCPGTNACCSDAGACGSEEDGGCIVPPAPPPCAGIECPAGTSVVLETCLCIDDQDRCDTSDDCRLIDDCCGCHVFSNGLPPECERTCSTPSCPSGSVSMCDRGRCVMGIVR